MKPLLGIVPQGWKYALPLLLLGAVLSALSWFWISAPVLVLGLYVLYFFRDPERKTPGIPNSVCSPADGKVVSVLEVPCDEMPGGRARRIAVFLNIFNVHVQRAPIAGVVRATYSSPGKFLNALNEKCSTENESVMIWLESEYGPVGCKQIAGAIARRIICNVNHEDYLQRGQRYGLIQFGSRVELFLPLEATVKVKPGQKVVAGETCMAVMFEEELRQKLRSSGEQPKKEAAAAP